VKRFRYIVTLVKSHKYTLETSKAGEVKRNGRRRVNVVALNIMSINSGRTLVGAVDQGTTNTRFLVYVSH